MPDKTDGWTVAACTVNLMEAAGTSIEGESSLGKMYATLYIYQPACHFICYRYSLLVVSYSEIVLVTFYHHLLQHYVVISWIGGR